MTKVRLSRLPGNSLANEPYNDIKQFSSGFNQIVPPFPSFITKGNRTIGTQVSANILDYTKVQAKSVRPNSITVFPREACFLSNEVCVASSGNLAIQQPPQMIACFSR